MRSAIVIVCPQAFGNISRVFQTDEPVLVRTPIPQSADEAVSIGALSRLGIAQLLLEHYPEEKAEALEHLNFAINEFREMKMQPYLEQALKHKEILGA